MNIYTDKDCDTSIIQSKNIAIIGYGAQGHAHALNLKDSGACNITVALRENSPSIEKVKAAGFDIKTPKAAAAHADVIMFLLPDEHQADLYAEIEPHIKQGAAIGFAHGLNIHFGKIRPRADLDVFMVAPKGPGYGVRASYIKGEGIPSLIAVAQDASGHAKNLTLSYAAAIGSGRSAIIETTFKDECETDLFGEQAVLCGGIPDIIKAGYETLVEAGYPEEIAYFECVHETKLIIDLIYEAGLSNMRAAISNTAEFGGYEAGARVVNEATKAEMKNILADIQSGKFVEKFIGGEKKGLKSLSVLREKTKQHPIENAGKRVRDLMPWIGKEK